MPHKHKFRTCGYMVETVVKEALIDALHKFIDRAHLGWPNELRWKPKPCILIPLAIIPNKLEGVLHIMQTVSAML